jgi:mannose-6-phosphate isomerase-like protein (cupin superfamily)
MKAICGWSPSLVVIVLVATFVVANPYQENNVTDSASGQEYAFDMAKLNRQRAEKGGPWLEFLNVESMYCGVYHLVAGAKDGQKPHPEDEVYFVQAGQSRFHMDGQEFEVAPGSVLFVPANKSHYFYDITEDLTMLVFFSKGPVKQD